MISRPKSEVPSVYPFSLTPPPPFHSARFPPPFPLPHDFTDPALLLFLLTIHIETQSLLAVSAICDETFHFGVVVRLLHILERDENRVNLVV